jgi:hypothetical protein
LSPELDAAHVGQHDIREQQIDQPGVMAQHICAARASLASGTWYPWRFSTRTAVSRTWSSSSTTSTVSFPLVRASLSRSG